VHASKTKLVWSVSKHYLQELSAKETLHEFAKEIIDFGIDAIHFQYSKETLPQTTQLKNELSKLCENMSGESQKYQKIPFMFSPVGRKAILRVRNSFQEVSQNQEITGIVCHSFSGCINTHAKADLQILEETAKYSEHVAFQIFLSSLDMLSSIGQGKTLSVSFGQIYAEIISWEPISNTTAIVKLKMNDSGTLLSGMDIHCDSMSRNLVPLIPEDEKTLNSRFDNLADYILLGGCENLNDLKKLKEICLGQDVNTSKRHPTISVGEKVRQRETQLSPKVLYKIDSSYSLNSLSEILTLVDGVLLSRSELSLWVPQTELPIIQKQVLAQCNQMAKLVIVASEIMYSMRQNPNPTRAEVSDLANTALDGADAVFLAEEVTEGPYRLMLPEVCGETLLNSEKQPAFQPSSNWNRVPFNIQNDDDLVAFGALNIAQLADAKAIVCLTEGGYTAQRLASLRAPIDILAVTFNECIARQLNALRSVSAHVLEGNIPLDSLLSSTKATLVKEKILNKGDKFVFVSLSASTISKNNSNMFTLQEVD
jgi:pyruvate kinase